MSCNHDVIHKVLGGEAVEQAPQDAALRASPLDRDLAAVDVSNGDRHDSVLQEGLDLSQTPIRGAKLLELGKAVLVVHPVKCLLEVLTEEAGSFVAAIHASQDFVPEINYEMFSPALLDSATLSSIVY